MGNFLFYWRPDSYRIGLLEHAAGAQLKKLAKGDHLWIVTIEDRKLILFGHMVVGRVVSKREAQLRLKNKDIWPAPWHALANFKKSEPMIDIDIAEHARRLRFQGGKVDKLPSAFTGLHLQSMRQLTDESARLLENVWTKNSNISEELAQLADRMEYEESFDPHDLSDARERILREIVSRRGQPRFRNGLLRAYSHRCAISESNAMETLEAAHIVPFRGTQTNHVSNGLLLRADLHTLFDLHLLAINPSDLRVRIAKRLNKTQYERYKGKKIRLPLAKKLQPNRLALADHFERAKRDGLI